MRESVQAESCLLDVFTSSASLQVAINLLFTIN